jgi:hypothetical protein
MTINDLDKATLERIRAYQRDVLIPSKNNQSNIDPELAELGRIIDEHNDMFIGEVNQDELD